VQVLVALPTPKCKALYDFQMKPTEEEGCLIFKKGAVIHVIRRVDQNWAEGRLGETIGIFPISFVEMNLLARQLMDASIHKSMPPSINSRTCPQPPVFEQGLSDSSTTTTSTTSPTSGDNTTTSSNSSTAPNSPITSASAVINRTPQSQEQLGKTATPSQQQQQQPANLIRIRDAKQEKRHSLTALMSNLSSANMSQHVLTASNRHSAEILGIPDVTSLQINSSISSSSSNNNKANNGQQQPSSSQAEHKSKSHNIQSRTKKLTSGPTATTFVALYPYKPQKPDELELKKGCK
jgi:E3 ubiquitin-protein ligase SH3RF